MECAVLANAVYSDPTLQDDTLLRNILRSWYRYDQQLVGPKIFYGAFQGAAFAKNNEVVFAFKGTEMLGRDGLTDGALALGGNTIQYNAATDFVKRTIVGDRNVYFVGHSLGGAIAQVLGNRMNKPFVTFNAPGVGLASGNKCETIFAPLTPVRMLGTVLSAVFHPKQAVEDLKAVGRRARGVNFHVRRDIVGNTGVHFGKVIHLPNPLMTGLNKLKIVSLRGHTMEVVFNAIIQSGYAARNINDL